MSADFRDAVLKAANKVCREYDLDFATFCLVGAQCIKETGESKLMQSHYAPLGIKATKQWLEAKPGRKCYNAKTNEEYTLGQLSRITACFRAYNSYEEAIEDWVQLINTKRYKPVRDAKTFEEKAKAIKDCGYATSSTYTEGLIKVFKTYCAEFDAAWNGITLLHQIPQGQEPTTNTYTVQRGDTLSSIAKKFNTTTWKLITLNAPKYPRIATSNGNFIMTGWVLKVC